MVKRKYFPRRRGPFTEEEFWKRIDKSAGPEGCWPWIAGRSKAGYGMFDRDGRKLYAHREAYVLAHGPIPEAMKVRHSCDNPPCCNARHLLAGTTQDNSDDMVQRGRSRYGERNHNTKFGDVLIARAVEAYRNREGSKTEIARRFGISQPHFSEILSGKLRAKATPIPSGKADS